MRTVPAWLLSYWRHFLHSSGWGIAAGALLATGSTFLPWFTISSSGFHYYAEVTPVAGLFDVGISIVTLVPVLILLGVDGCLLLIGLALPALRTHTPRRALAVIALILTLAVVGLIVLADVLSPATALSYPYATPAPGIGQCLAGIGYFSVAVASIASMRQYPNNG